MTISQGVFYMETIRPSSDLRNHYSEISRQCHKEKNPVIITGKRKRRHGCPWTSGILSAEIGTGIAEDTGRSRGRCKRKESCSDAEYV
jgi:hypothetical protein